MLFISQPFKACNMFSRAHLVMGAPYNWWTTDRLSPLEPVRINCHYRSQYGPIVTIGASTADNSPICLVEERHLIDLSVNQWLIIYLTCASFCLRCQYQVSQSQGTYLLHNCFITGAAKLMKMDVCGYFMNPLAMLLCLYVNVTRIKYDYNCVAFKRK